MTEQSHEAEAGAEDPVTAADGSPQHRELHGLANRLRTHVQALSTSSGSLVRLMEDLDERDPDQLRTWAELDLLDLIDSDLVIEKALDDDARLNRMELIRSALIFLPIAVTWLGIALAARAYGQLPTDVERYQDASFIALWETGFDGRAGFSISLFQIGVFDFLLILGLIGATLAAARRRRSLESHLNGELLLARDTLLQVQRALVDHRLHGIARFRTELTGAAKQLRTITTNAVGVSSATTAALDASTSTLSAVASAADAQREALGGLDERLRSVETSVAQLAGLQQQLAVAHDGSLAELREIAKSAAVAAERTYESGSALNATAGEIGVAMRHVDAVLEGAAARMGELDERLTTERSAQEAMFKSMRSLAGRLQAIETAAESLATASGSLQTTLGTIGSTVSVASKSIPAAMASAVAELGTASEHLSASARQHGEVVRNVSGIATSLEVALAQAHAELVGILTALGEARAHAEEVAGGSAASHQVSR